VVVLHAIDELFVLGADPQRSRGFSPAAMGCASWLTCSITGSSRSDTCRVLMVCR